MSLERLVHEWGYLAVLVGTFLEGETILVIAGVAAQQGHLQLQYVMVAAFCGSLVSDQLAFFIGRRWGMRWLTKKPGRAERYERARALIDRHQILITLLFRFLYGLRNVIPFALGMSRMKTSRYVALNVIGAAVWAVVLAVLGWAFGAAAEMMVNDVKASQRWILLGVVIAGVLFWAWYKWRERKKLRKRIAEQDPSTKTEAPL